MDLRPDYPAALAGLGMAYWRKYRDQRDPMWLKLAAENAGRAVELDPQLTIGLVGLAFVNVERGELELAEQGLADALSLDPANADAFAARASLRLRQADFPEALAAVRRAVEIRPGDWSLSLMEGVILMSAGDHAQAASALERASKAAPRLRYTSAESGARRPAGPRRDDRRDERTIDGTNAVSRPARRRAG